MKKFYFNNFNINLSNNYLNENFTELDDIFNKFKGKEYSIKLVKEIKDKLDNIALRREFVFINTKYTEEIIDENKINIDFYLDDIEKSYVERINIFGNFITEEKVIRNSLIVDEGDPFNKILFTLNLLMILNHLIFSEMLKVKL